MFCSSCGKKITDKSKFCKHCGSSQAEIEEGKKNKKTNKKNYEVVWTCDYCGEEFKTKEESDSHEIFCDKNPKRKKRFFKNISQRAWFYLWIITLSVFIVSLLINAKFISDYDIELFNNDSLSGLFLFNILVGVNAFLAMVVASFKKNVKASFFTSKIFIISITYFLINTSVFASEGIKAKNNEEYKNKFYVETKPTPIPSVAQVPTITEFQVKSKTQVTTNKSNTGSQIDCIGPDGKQFRTTMDECKKLNETWGKPVDYMINCNIHSDCGGGTIYMAKSQCDLPCSGIKNTKTSPETTNNSTNYPPCTIYYPSLNRSETYYYTSPSDCQNWKDSANAGSTQIIPTSSYVAPTSYVYQTPTPNQAEIEARILTCKSLCESTRSSAIVDLQREAKALGNAGGSWYESRLNSINATYYWCISQCN